VGIRNISELIVGGVSPFNIADEFLLPPFSLKNVRDLYAQYTMETNQDFTEEAIHKIYDQTCGQPCLFNRLGTILTVNTFTTSYTYPFIVPPFIARLAF